MPINIPLTTETVTNKELRKKDGKIFEVVTTERWTLIDLTMIEKRLKQSDKTISELTTMRDFINNNT